MANRSYLCATDQRATYPSTKRSYDSDKQTLACDVWCVPLLWTALFRAPDIVAKTFELDDGPLYTEAPLVSRTKAIRQLNEALPYYNRLFAKEGPLDEYAAFLRKALEGVKHKYVTIELDEIAGLVGHKKYHALFRAALAGIGSDTSARAKKRFVEIAQFRKLKRFPPPRLLLDNSKRRSDDDCWNHCRICGAGRNVAGLGRRVPWEPK
jgi:hypothetical protein